MSDSKDKASATITTADGTVMSKGDIEFLMVCIQNTNSGSLVIDPGKVAEACNMKNARSASNRVGKIKQKYGLPLSTSTKGGDGPAVPKTPKTNKVTKKTASAKKTAGAKKSSKKVKNEETDNEAEAEDEDEPEQETEQQAEDDAEDEEAEAMVSTPSAVKLTTPQLEELCFGKADTDEEENQDA